MMVIQLDILLIIPFVTVPGLADWIVGQLIWIIWDSDIEIAIWVNLRLEAIHTVV